MEHLRAIAGALAAEDTPLAVRDLAVLLTGVTSALRSANLALLRLEDVEFCAEGVRLSHPGDVEAWRRERFLGSPPVPSGLTRQK